MIKFFSMIILLILATSCTNTDELETGEIKTLLLLKEVISKSKKPKSFLDSRLLLSREKIDAFNIPILFVELETGQNGTLTQYPGQNIGQTWLGADGATITLDRGILKATRGMGDDLMGSSNNMPSWSKIDYKGSNYVKTLSYLGGNNRTYLKKWNCKIKKISEKQMLEVWKVSFLVERYEESCSNKKNNISNIYYLDEFAIVRRSNQFHSDTVGYITIERIDR